jgi:actin-related protein 4
MEINNPYNSDGIVEDWETVAKLWEYTITSRLTGARQTPPSKNGLNDKTDENGDTNMDEGMEQAGEQEKILQEFPLLMSEPAWNPAKERQKTIEIAMEDWGVPAFFLAKTGQLAAYVVLYNSAWRTLANGKNCSYSQSKATALVVDIGALNTSVTALWDGMVLTKSESAS